MKTTFKKNLGQCFLFISLMWLVSYAALADQPIKDNDQDLRIITDGKCVKSISLASTNDNCMGTEFQDSCGRKGKDCVCMRKNKSLTWSIDNYSNFEIQFPDEGKPSTRCKLKSGSKRTVTCKINADTGDFKYNVVADSCPGVVYDPKIVIRN
jgi:hypothetical protein